MQWAAVNTVLHPISVAEHSPSLLNRPTEGLKRVENAIGDLAFDSQGLSAERQRQTDQQDRQS